MKEEELEKIFNEFLDSYLHKVVEVLPDSYRAKQLMSEDAFLISLVFETEAKFLKEPVMEAMRKIIQEVGKLLGNATEDEEYGYTLSDFTENEWKTFKKVIEGYFQT
jgi:hypothetical protein